MLKWLGSITGILGALMLASNTSISGYGYILFTISSFILVFVFKSDLPMLLQQSLFLTINTIGLFQWIIL